MVVVVFGRYVDCLVVSEIGCIVDVVLIGIGICLKKSVLMEECFEV